MPFSFPGSTRRKGDQPEDPNELTFRDGKRVVAEYLRILMTGIDTPRYSYDEAIKLMNGQMGGNFANRALDRKLRSHFGGR